MTWIIFGLTLFAFGVSLLLPIHRMIYFFFCYIAIEGSLKILSNYHPFIHVGADVYAALIYLKIIAVSAKKRSPRDRIPPLMPLFALHFAWFLVTFLNPYQISPIASIAGAKVYVTMVLLYFVGFTYATSFERIRTFAGVWVGVLGVQAVVSVIQAVIGPSSVTQIHPGYAALLLKFSGYAFRPFGFTPVPGGPAVYVFLVNSFLLYFLFESKKAWAVVFAALTLILAWITLFMCQVRSAIIKTLFSTAIFSWFYVRRFFARTLSEGVSLRKAFPIRFAVLIVLFTALSLYSWSKVANLGDDVEQALARSLTAFDYSALTQARMNTGERFWNLVRTVPFGAGLSRTGAAAGKFTQANAEDPYFKYGFFTDNFWMAVLVDLGIPGMILMTLIVFAILWRGMRSRIGMKDPRLRALNAIILCSLFASVIGFYGAEAILYNPEAAFFWFFSGVLLKLPYLDRARAVVPAKVAA